MLACRWAPASQVGLPCSSSLRNWIADLEALPRSLSYLGLSYPSDLTRSLSASAPFPLPCQAYVGHMSGLRGVGPALPSHHSRIQAPAPRLRNWIADLEALPRSLSVTPGTCTSSLRNWIADLEALPRSLSVTPFRTLSFPFFPANRHIPRARVHRGFYSAYHFTRLRPAVVGVVLFLTTILPSSYRVAFTGHSLGGALATLSALDLQVGGWGFPGRERWVAGVSLVENGEVSYDLPSPDIRVVTFGSPRVSYDLPSPAIRVVTFGSPRVGNAAFAAYFRQKVPGSTRVTNWKDLVPHLPPATIGYHHVATEAWIIPDSVHNVSFSSRGGASSGERDAAGGILMPNQLFQRRSLQRRVFQRRSLERQSLQRGKSLHRQLLQDSTHSLDEMGSQARHQGNLTWHVHQCDETGEDPCCSRSVVGDSIANDMRYLGVLSHALDLSLTPIRPSFLIPFQNPLPLQLSLHLPDRWSVVGNSIANHLESLGMLCCLMIQPPLQQPLPQSFPLSSPHLPGLWSVVGDSIANHLEQLGVPSYNTASSPTTPPSIIPPLLSHLSGRWSVVGDSIANHLEQLGVPSYNTASSPTTPPSIIPPLLPHLSGRSVVGDSIANHLEYLGVPCYSPLSPSSLSSLSFPAPSILSPGR
ncbi:unnamed protein product [Closterium sp. Naga37s-1]|nr:unnamed protein product [Closterium sp. Naga37s-1]